MPAPSQHASEIVAAGEAPAIIMAALIAAVLTAAWKPVRDAWRRRRATRALVGVLRATGQGALRPDELGQLERERRNAA